MRQAFFASIAGVLLAMPAVAQDEEPQDIPFEGGTLTITQNEDFEKILTFDGKELARNYQLFYNRTVVVAGKNVALFDIGDGGNMCGTNAVIVWKPDQGEVEATIAGEDCGSPPAAVTDDSIYFVPYLLPGASKPVEVWTPADGMELAGNMSFAPKPGTGWADLDPAKVNNMIDTFSNADVYAAAQAMLGDEITQVANGLIVGGDAQVLPTGAFWSSGCVPHACGSYDAFMAIDAKGKKLYFAQQQDSGETKTWPALGEWPKDVAEAARSAIPMPE
jgi:hypothetical protein